ncbi:hypothetical protein A0J47_018275 [Photobacterium damselae subsp. damselae]|uniref:hypothetical protein n=1 Tax=Photobacterium damselae TaxID=38293 RepID=UPI00083A2C9C|nr:hypothetical protein [Photobacterium damselae]KAB1181211.1 hypothetical protein F6477_06305 [Photobacterium damselae subsp. damselae]MBF7098653.1 hypothetical protein [Photobacterium damselae]PSB80418.1 hypothetical protein C5F61_03745 [Photobacterium damselae subsp. damselae]QSH58658.1 hypothetical protein A0J47_018275 [Photobacterium damselae subsp. damselae]
MMSVSLNAWQHLSLNEKLSQLAPWVESLNTQQQALIHFHCQNIENQMISSVVLTGATGEENTLTLQPKGLVCAVCDKRANELGVLAQVIVPLLMGCSVHLFTYPMEKEQVKSLNLTLLMDLIPSVFSLHLFETVIPFVFAHEVRVISYQGDSGYLLGLQRAILEKEGPLISFVVDTQPQTIPILTSCDLWREFVSERVLTINVTAIGGNARLLAQTQDSDH